jgi:hypothetical protein
MIKHPARLQHPRAASPQERRFRALRKRLVELKELYAEANMILQELLIRTSAASIRGLCARFRILQDYFALRYQEARALAFAALGRIETVLSFP